MLDLNIYKYMLTYFIYAYIKLSPEWFKKNLAPCMCSIAVGVNILVSSDHRLSFFCLSASSKKLIIKFLLVYISLQTLPVRFVVFIGNFKNLVELIINCLFTTVLTLEVRSTHADVCRL